MEKRSIVKLNQRVWDRRVAAENQWTLPVSPAQVEAAKRGNVEIYLTPWKRIPADWLNNLESKRALCLAGGGGQQGPLLAAAGARVTVLDISGNQLRQDFRVKARENLRLSAVLGDMSELTMFPDRTFDLIIHPVSNCFIPDILPLWKEAFRVLRDGGELLSGFANPVIYSYDEPAEGSSDPIIIKNKIPHRDDEMPPEKMAEAEALGDAALEFGHSLDDQIGGQIAAGFSITGFYEDKHHRPEHPIYDIMPTFIATRALKKSADGKK